MVNTHGVYGSVGMTVDIRTCHTGKQYCLLVFQRGMLILKMKEVGQCIPQRNEQKGGDGMRCGWVYRGYSYSCVCTNSEIMSSNPTQGELRDLI